MQFLIDSNIIIYSYSNEYTYLREIITSELAAVSEISRVEVLGYHKLNPDEEKYFQDIFSFVPGIDLSKEILERAIKLRKQYQLKLGDSLIAATALVHHLTFYTRNTNDFEKIRGLRYINPIR